MGYNALVALRGHINLYSKEYWINRSDYYAPLFLVLQSSEYGKPRTCVELAEFFNVAYLPKQRDALRNSTQVCMIVFELPMNH